MIIQAKLDTWKQTKTRTNPENQKQEDKGKVQWLRTYSNVCGKLKGRLICNECECTWGLNRQVTWNENDKELQFRTGCPLVAWWWILHDLGKRTPPLYTTSTSNRDSGSALVPGWDQMRLWVLCGEPDPLSRMQLQMRMLISVCLKPLCFYCLLELHICCFPGLFILPGPFIHDWDIQGFPGPGEHRWLVC